MSTIKTVCNLCGLSACGMQLDIESGAIVAVRGDASDLETRGALCAKGRALREIVYSPQRLKQPVRRVGSRGEGKWQAISWDEALDFIANQLQRIKASFGAEAVWFHKGCGHDSAAGDVRGYLHRLANLFGTPNLSAPVYLCHGPRLFNMFLVTGGVPAPDIENSRCVVLWGTNPAHTALPRRLQIQDALKRGARLIVVDPRKTHFAARADLHLQPRPGTDGALALAMLKVMVDEVLFDQAFVKRWTIGFGDLIALLGSYSIEHLAAITTVPADAIRSAARLYATSGPACIFLGQALDQQTNTSAAIRAITSMMAICGYLDVAGGNVLLPPTRLAKTPVELHDKLPPEQASKRLGGEFPLTNYPFTRLAHPPSGYRAILEGTPYPVKAMFIMASNPAVTDPDSTTVQQALKRLDFLAVADIVMTPTAQLADVVLPACTFAEQTYYATYEASAHGKPAAPGLIKLRPRAVPPLADSWPDWKIIFELGKRLGYAEYFAWPDIEAAIDEELRPVGITVRELRAHPEGLRVAGLPILYQRLGSKRPLGRIAIQILNKTVFRAYPRMYRKYRLMGFMTPSRKVELRSAQLAALGLDAVPVYRDPAYAALTRAYPLVLTTGAKPQWFVHSQMREVESLVRHMPENLAEVHPTTAAESGVQHGKRMFIQSPRGRIECRAHVTRDIVPGVVHVFPGFAEANANVLTDSASLDPITGSAPIGTAACRIGAVDGDTNGAED
jgi:formate dehydrogenase (coenzyme F420) alpha subunit